MFAATRVAFGAVRMPMTSKRGHNYYKGKRTGSMGNHTKHGGYVIDWKKVRHFVAPDLKNCELKPYVTLKAEPPARSLTLQDFLPSVKKV
ncbi:MAG: mitochondrial ribosomal protein L27-domain-containing protein [Piptocephalis tieghemiana]|nr:MAG: mitochondrial ribosomal protein L27-domain-containing protein [Piptocephalis tieghemiana]